MGARRLTAQLALGVCALAFAGGAAGCGLIGGDTRTLTASFDRTVALYENSDVRILGVKVGTVTSLEPNGRTVSVEMEYDAQYQVPADAKAVIIAPSIVSDRYVQLVPAYTGGPVLADGAVLAANETAIPVELDEIFAAINEVSLTLGPRGANADGALSDLLDVASKNLAGNGKALNTTLTNVSTAVTTLADQRADLFGTVRNLSAFTTTLARADDTVRQFNRSLAAVAEQLEGEKEDLALAIRQLSIAFGQVAGFVRENKASLTANISDLADLTGVLVKQKAALEEFLDTAPVALSNLQLAYNPVSGTLDTRANNLAGQLGSSLCALGQGSLPQPLIDLCGALLDGLSVNQIERLLLHPENLAPALVERLQSLLGGVAAVAGDPATLTTRPPSSGLTVTDLLEGRR